MHTDDETVDILGYLSRLKRFWLPATAVALAVLLALSALPLLSKTTPEHNTKAHVMVQPARPQDAAGADLQVQLLPLVMRTLIALEDVPSITESVSKKMGGRFTPEQVAEMTTFYWGGGGMLLAVRADAPEEQDSLDLANATAQALVEQAGDVLKLPAGEMPRLVQVEQAKDDPAFQTTTAPSKLSGLKTAIPAAVLAWLATAFLLEWLSSRRRRRGATAATSR